MSNCPIRAHSPEFPPFPVQKTSPMPVMRAFVPTVIPPHGSVCISPTELIFFL